MELVRIGAYKTPLELKKGREGILLSSKLKK